MSFGSCPIPDPLTYHSTTNDYNVPLGFTFEYPHATYGQWRLRFVQMTANSIAASTAGMVTIKVAANGTTVTCDSSSGDGIAGTPPGGIVIPASVAISEYFFVLVKGYYPTVQTDGDDDIAAGDYILTTGGADGKCESLANAGSLTGAILQTVVGTARAADVDADNTVAVDVGVPFAI